MVAASKKRTAPGRESLATLGANLRRLRTRRGLSIERLAEVAGISRAMISQIELGKSSPTINVLSKLSAALGLPFAGLLTPHAPNGATVVRASAAAITRSEEGQLRSRALSPTGRSVDLYEMTLAALAVEKTQALPAGTWQNLVVAAGTVEIDVGGIAHRLETGDSILFAADVPHAYRNREATIAVMYLVVQYREP